MAYSGVSSLQPIQRMNIIGNDKTTQTVPEINKIVNYHGASQEKVNYHT